MESLVLFCYKTKDFFMNIADELTKLVDLKDVESSLKKNSNNKRKNYLANWLGAAFVELPLTIFT